MACELTITDVTGVTIGGVLTSIVVTGEATNCASVTVSIDCGDGNLRRTGVLVDTSSSPGTWTFTFPAIQGCSCTDQIRVVARCDDQVETCIARFDGQLECVPGDDDLCCPSITSSSVTIDDDCTYEVSVGLDSLCSYSAVLRDSSDLDLDTLALGSGPRTLTGSGNYTGAETFRVIITSLDGCPGFSLTGSGPSCQTCPNVFLDSSTSPGPGAGESTVVVTAALTPPDPTDLTYVYSAQLWDETDLLDELTDVSGPQGMESPPAVLSVGTSKLYTTVITDPPGCGTTVLEVDAEGGGEPGNGGGGWGCELLRILIAVGAAVAIFAVLLAFCIPAAWQALAIAAAIAAIIALIAGIAYQISLCPKPCNWPLLTSGQAAIGAGVVVVIFSQCCPWVLWAGLVLIAGGLTTLEIWARRCKETQCQVAKEITKVVSGIVPPLVGIVLLIPAVQACYSPTANLLVGVILSPIVHYAVTCDE